MSSWISVDWGDLFDASELDFAGLRSDLSVLYNTFDAGKRKVRRFSRTFYSLLPTERWVQNRWIFCDIFICSKDTQQFRFLGFLTVHKTTLLKVVFTLNSDPLEFLRYLLPFKRYQWKHLIFFNSAWPQGEAFLIKKVLLWLQNIVEWAVVKINHFCFLLREAKIQSCPVKLT